MSSPISTGVKFNFNYSFDSKQLTVYLNLNKLVDSKLNLINNNLNINLNDDDNDEDENEQENEDTAASSDNKLGHVEREKKSTNLNELLYLIVDELDTKVRSSLAVDDGGQSANAITLMNNLYFLKYFLLVSDEFKHKLKHFLHAKYNEYYAGKYASAMRELGPDRSHILKRYWGDINRALANSLDEMNLNNINILGKMYHKLMHSNYMNLILKQEYLYTIEYNKKLNQFMLLGSTNDQDELWSTRIESLKTKQQRLFSKFLFKLYDELNSTQGSKSNNSGSGLSSSNSQVSMKLDINDYLDKSDLELDVDDLSNVISLNKIKFINTDNNSNTSGEEQQQQQQQPLGDETAPGGKKNQPRRFADQSFTRIEESYTIQLGAQLKTTHNLRLIRCDILDYCKDRFKLNAAANDPSNLFSFVELHTISTAMSLFSENKLCALVLLVDCCLDKAKLNFPASSSSSDDVSSKFFQICHKNGYDFQFQSIEQQIETAIDCINGVNAAKNAGQKTANSCLAKMNIGDFFITKHSNLSQTHIVFHLAAYDSSAHDSEQHNNTLKKSDLSSRHPVILGLRNILKTCINHNIQTLTFPLLLSHQMTEEMTINWVMKRAELVLKCIKGFMIEFVQWGSQDSRDLQFVVPQGLIDETFNSVSSLVKTIFRESRAYLLQ